MNTVQRFHSFLICAIIITMIVAGPVYAQSSTDRSLISEVRSATLSGVIDIAGTVTLREGSWKGRAFIDGGAERPSVHVVEEMLLVGDVNTDRSMDLLTFIISSTGGSGTQVSFALFFRHHTSLKNTVTVWLGDRTQVRSGKIDSSGTIELVLVRMGDGDAMCCPGEMVKRRWVWKNGALKELPEIPLGRFSTVSLERTVWKLYSWKAGELVDTNTAVTLSFAGDRISGRSACNQYFARCENGGTPGTILVGTHGSTKMMCSPELMATEDRFLRLLPLSKHFSFVFGRLQIEYELNGVRNSLIFLPETQ